MIKFFQTWLILCILCYTPCYAGYKDYFQCKNFCLSHQKIPDNKLSVLPYCHLIPTALEKCEHVTCSLCNNAFISEKRFYNENNSIELSTVAFWTCDCKIKEQLSYEKEMPEWQRCEKNSISSAYLNDQNQRYFDLFIEYLQYLESNPSCKCLWPETSKQASHIKDKAYYLFSNLLKNTALKELITDLDKQCNFILGDNQELLSTSELVKHFITHSFFYSDYEIICRDLEFYSQNFSARERTEIKDHLENIRVTLASLFVNLYIKCAQNHPTERINLELKLLKNDSAFDFNINANELKPAYQDFINTKASFFHSPKDTNVKSNWLLSNILLKEGSLLNDIFLHEAAIIVLTDAIKYNLYNKEAFIERAIAYFETNQLELAIIDYETAKKLEKIPIFLNTEREGISLTDYDPNKKRKFIPDDKLDFSTGFLSGTLNGIKISGIEFLPSLLDTCRGLGSCLWAFVCSPAEVSEELLNASYDLAEFLSSATPKECLEVVVPELKDLLLTWKNIDDHTKGSKIGFIIGKYSVDIFAPIGAARGIAKIKTLKRINAMQTFEICTSSPTKKAKILEESASRAFARESVILEAVKKGKILPHNSNVQFHVMQKKHAWDKIINLSGNVEEDFKKVLILLEEEQINSFKYFKDSEEVANKIIRLEYEKNIFNKKVKAIFSKYPDKEQIFLYNAWVYE